MADLGDAKREDCRLKYRDYKNVPWQACEYCSEKSKCGKPRPDGGKS
jgi:hypothetical protein